MRKHDETTPKFDHRDILNTLLPTTPKHPWVYPGDLRNGIHISLKAKIDVIPGEKILTS
jgi:hypothetical protein